MAGLDTLAATLQARLEELVAEHGVVGASVAVQQGDEIVEAATGIANLASDTRVTTRTAFQIGSISKTYTATLVMQLVGEGLVDLDTPVVTYLPEFRLRDAQATAAVTVRQLLSHTSGIDGDVFENPGDGADCIERYVAGMAELALTNRPGLFSYCNSGFVLLGRLIERLRGLTFDDALRTHLLEPLGAADTVTLADNAILRPHAVGHLPTGEDGAMEVAPVWFLGRASGPAGGVIATARDVLRFARMHLDEGKAADGTQVLGPAEAKAMQQFQVEQPDPTTLGDAWGLGWILYTLAGPTVFGHDGTTIGQNAYLRVVPEHDLAVTLLTNGGNATALFNALVRDLLRELAGAELNRAPTPPDPPADVDPAPFLGTYERSGVRLEIGYDDDGDLVLVATPTGPLASVVPAEPPHKLVVLDDSRLLTAEPEPKTGTHTVLAFLDPTETGFAYVHMGVRATPRASGA